MKKNLSFHSRVYRRVPGGSSGEGEEDDDDDDEGGSASLGVALAGRRRVTLQRRILFRGIVLLIAIVVFLTTKLITTITSLLRMDHSNNHATRQPDLHSAFVPSSSVSSPGIQFRYERRPEQEQQQRIQQLLWNDPRRVQQIHHYRNGTALMIHIHITHHGGTTFCQAIGHALNAKGRTPNFACWKEWAETSIISKHDNHEAGSHYDIESNGSNLERMYLHRNPWTHNQTAEAISVLRRTYHMISWEYDLLRQSSWLSSRTSSSLSSTLPSWGIVPPPSPRKPSLASLCSTEWENPHLLSILIVRHPLQRMLAGDAYVEKYYPGLRQGRGTYEQWWNFSRSILTDNYALRTLAGDCSTSSEPTQSNITPNSNVEEDEDDTKSLHVMYDRAVTLLQRFTILLDIECLTDSIHVLANVLRLHVNGKALLGSARLRNRSGGGMSDDTTAKQPLRDLKIRDRIPFDDIYDYLAHRNQWDIALYEWARSRSLLDCSLLTRDRNR